MVDEDVTAHGGEGGTRSGLPIHMPSTCRYMGVLLHIHFGGELFDDEWLVFYMLSDTVSLLDVSMPFGPDQELEAEKQANSLLLLEIMLSHISSTGLGAREQIFVFEKI